MSRRVPRTFTDQTRPTRRRSTPIWPRRRDDPGARDDRVEAPEVTRRGLDRELHVRGAAHVTDESEHRVTVVGHDGVEVGRRRQRVRDLGNVATAIDRDHSVAVVHKSIDGRRADAACRASDDGDATH